MDQGQLSGLHHPLPQANHPQIGQAGGNQQPFQMLGVADRAVSQIETATFLVGEESFNGTITNDKFCMSRIRQLTLNWSRCPLRLRDLASKSQPSSLDEITHHGGSHEAPLESLPNPDTQTRRATSLGPGLPTPSARELSPGDAAPLNGRLPHNPGGEECE